MNRFLIPVTLSLASFLTPITAMAENFMFSYNTELGPYDAYNSRGAPLEGWCTILQQDRANWHRFNRRDRYDEADPFFSSPERRAMMAGKCEVRPGVFADPGAQIRSGNRQFYLNIQIFGDGERITRIRMTDGP